MNYKYLVFLAVIFAFITRVGLTQPWYFNNIYNPNNTWSSGLSIIGNDGGYFGCSISCDSISDYYFTTCPFILNQYGELISWKSFGRIGADFFAGDEGALTKSGNNFGLFTAVQDWENDSFFGIFYKFDQNGDTIFTRYFTSDTFNILTGRTCTATNDGGFALVGEVSEDFNASDIVMIKIDSTGNEHWRNQLGTEVDDWPKSVIQTSDGGYAISSWSRIQGFNETADPIVFKTDSLGNFEWSINLGGPFMDDKAMLCMTLDSCIMVLTAYADSMYTPDYGYSRINLVKLDLQGNTLWNRKFGASKPVNFISNLILTANGEFLACGYSKYSVYLPRAGWLFRFNASGDSIWYRDYFYYPEDPGYGINYLFDVSETEDNGFITTGQASTFDPPNNIQKMWVLKVDSVGCEIENCWVGIEEQGGGEAWERGSGEAGRHGDLEVWPNPASGVLSVKCLGLNVGISYSLSVVDIFGRAAPTPALPPTGGEGEIVEWTVNVTKLPPGIYLAVVRDEKGFLRSAKFIVAR